jgi:hypothetical protein
MLLAEGHYILGKVLIILQKPKLAKRYLSI